MTVIGLLLFLALFVGFAVLARWIITTFLPPPTHMLALAIVGVLLLVVLLAAIFPSSLDFQLF